MKKTKKQIIKALVPCSGMAVLSLGVTAVIIAENIDADPKKDINDCLFPKDVNVKEVNGKYYIEPILEDISKSESDKIILYLGQEKILKFDEGNNPFLQKEKVYEIIDSMTIENIMYSDDNNFIVITFKDSSMSYTGTYNYNDDDYIFSSCTDKKAKIKSLTK